MEKESREKVKLREKAIERIKKNVVREEEKRNQTKRQIGEVNYNSLVLA